MHDSPQRERAGCWVGTGLAGFDGGIRGLGLEISQIGIEGEKSKTPAGQLDEGAPFCN